MFFTIFNYFKGAFPFVQFYTIEESKLEFVIFPFLVDVVRNYLRATLNSDYRIVSGFRNDGFYVFQIYKLKK